MGGAAALNSDRRRYRRHNLVWPQFCDAPERMAHAGWRGAFSCI